MFGRRVGCLAVLTTQLSSALQSYQLQDSKRYDDNADALITMRLMGREHEVSEQGFQQVVATGSEAAMGAFVEKVVQSQNLYINNRGFMKTVLPYYTGECSNQSYGILLGEITRARKANWCHPAWVGSKDGAQDLHADKDYMKPRVEKSIKQARFTLLRSIISEMGGTVLRGKRNGLWQFSKTSMQKNSTLEDLATELRNTESVREWLSFKGLYAPRNLKLDGGMKDWMNNVGSTAPLNEDGYRAVVFLRNESQMATFIQRAGNKLGVQVTNQDGLMGMTPYFSGRCARQSYEALEKEVGSMVPVSYMTTMTYDVLNATALPSWKELRMSIAELTGIDVSRVKVTSADILQNHTVLNTTMPRKLLGTKSNKTLLPGAVALSAQHVFPDIAPPQSKRFTISVVAESDDASKTLADALNFVGLPNMTGSVEVHDHPFTEPVVGSNKPGKCGGGLGQRGWAA